MIFSLWRLSYLTLSLTLITSFAKSQNTPELIKMWQASYPQIELISQDTYQKLSEQEREILKKVPHIVFQDAISVHEINAYAIENELLTIEYSEKHNSEHLVSVKEWLTNHPEVKVVKRSDYNRMDSAQQAEIQLNGNIMLLKGETVSLEDINSFTTNK